MTNKLKTVPTQEPVTLAEAKAHLRVTAADEDTLITSLITAARQAAESFTQAAFFTQTWVLSLDAFELQICLPTPPVQSIVSVSYIDTDGVVQTVLPADYVLHSNNSPALLVTAYDKSWPDSRAELNAVTIEYIAGYTSVGVIPGSIKAAILLKIGDLYRNREDVSPEQSHVLPFSSESLLQPYKVITF